MLAKVGKWSGPERPPTARARLPRRRVPRRTVADDVLAAGADAVPEAVPWLARVSASSASRRRPGVRPELGSRPMHVLRLLHAPHALPRVSYTPYNVGGQTPSNPMSLHPPVWPTRSLLVACHRRRRTPLVGRRPASWQLNPRNPACGSRVLVPRRLPNLVPAVYGALSSACGGCGRGLSPPPSLSPSPLSPRLRATFLSHFCCDFHFLPFAQPNATGQFRPGPPNSTPRLPATAAA